MSTDFRKGKGGISNVDKEDMGEVRVEGDWNVGTLPALRIPVLNVSRAMSCKQALT